MVPRRFTPLRTFLATSTVLGLVLLYLLWWTSYAGSRLEPGFTALEPGQAGRAGGSTVRLESLTTGEQLADQRYGGDPAPAAEGTVWLVAVLEAVTDPGSEPSCAFELVGLEGQRWPPTVPTGRALPSCGSAEVTPGRPARFEVVFVLPVRFRDRVAGVAVLDRGSAGRPDQVLRPPP